MVLDTRTVLGMQVTVEFTHIRGQKSPRGRGLAPLSGPLTTYVRSGTSGVHLVAQIRHIDPVKPPLAELHDVRLYAIAPAGMHLRGLELVRLDGADTYMLQGWLVSIDRLKG